VTDEAIAFMALAMLSGLGLSMIFSGDMREVLTRRPFDVLLYRSQETLETLVSDLGIFHGGGFRKFFGEVVINKIKRLKPKTPAFDIEQWTFHQHWTTFGVCLGVMATNLETLKSVLFSHLTTPNFPVATAVRMSMGIPGVFKPVRITDDDRAFASTRKSELSITELKGLYVDGGLLNNIPLRVADYLVHRLKSGATQSREQPTVLRPSTLGLRLEVEKPKSIQSLGDMLQVWPMQIGVFGTGEADIHKSLGTEDRSILLQTDPLTLLDFAPASGTLSNINERSRIHTWQALTGENPPRAQ
jgi:hypothetical protein